MLCVCDAMRPWVRCVCNMRVHTVCAVLYVCACCMHVHCPASVHCCMHVCTVEVCTHTRVWCASPTRVGAREARLVQGGSHTSSLSSGQSALLPLPHGDVCCEKLLLPPRASHALGGACPPACTLATLEAMCVCKPGPSGLPVVPQVPRRGWGQWGPGSRVGTPAPSGEPLTAGWMPGPFCTVVRPGVLQGQCASIS